jgi:hypothetical protein
MKRRLAILLLCAVPGLALADTAPAQRTLNAEIPAAALKKLTLHVGVGEVHVDTSGDDKVHVRVTLRQKEQEALWFFHWMSSGTAEDIASASIQQRVQGSELTIGLNYRGDQGSDDLKQEWEVQVPAHFTLDTDMKVGELNVADVAGGVEATLNVGELSIDVPRGAIRADVNVGEIRAKSGDADYGDVHLSSTIGEAVVYLNGAHMGIHDHSGLGNDVSFTGKGHDEMHLSVNIGEASLRITTPDAPKDGAK